MVKIRPKGPKAKTVGEVQCLRPKRASKIVRVQIDELGDVSL